MRYKKPGMGLSPVFVLRAKWILTIFRGSYCVTIKNIKNVQDFLGRDKDDQ
jgi:hypothetical protein